MHLDVGRRSWKGEKLLNGGRFIKGKFEAYITFCIYKFVFLGMKISMEICHNVNFYNLIKCKFSKFFLIILNLKFTMQI